MANWSIIFHFKCWNQEYSIYYSFQVLCNTIYNLPLVINQSHRSANRINFDQNVQILPSLLRSDGNFFNYISLKLEIKKLQFNPRPGLTPFYATPRIVLFSFGCDVFIYWYNFEYNSSKCSCWGELSDYNTISYFLGVKK